MSESGYTPSTESVRIAFGYVDESTPEIYEARVEAFDRWLASHDAVIREDQAKKDAAIVESMREKWPGVHITALHGLVEVPPVRKGGSTDLLIGMTSTAILSQSFTGTESEQNG